MSTLDSLSDTYKSLQSQLSTSITARERLESQQQENKSVQTIFTTLKEDDEESTIYKLVGPVLLKQEKAEARMAVDARLEFIGKEIGRIEGQIEETKRKMEGVQGQIYQLQAQAQGGA